MRLLFVDDAQELLELAERAFTREGHEVRVAGSVEGALACLRDETPDVLVLDVQLPDGTGVELCRTLRRQGSKVPILLLTAYGEVARRVEGLDAGADDFLAKPFAMAELRARVRALARRGPIERTSRTQVGAVELDVSARQALRDGVEVPVTAREWSVLELLLSRRGGVVSRTHILESVWGEDTDGARASLDVIVGRIRRKLGPEVVRTVRGEGYVIDAD
jgi:DNA-binding response OmpR family regulator